MKTSTGRFALEERRETCQRIDETGRRQQGTSHLIGCLGPSAIGVSQRRIQRSTAPRGESARRRGRHPPVAGARHGRRSGIHLRIERPTADEGSTTRSRVARGRDGAVALKCGTANARRRTVRMHDMRGLATVFQSVTSTPRAMRASQALRDCSVRASDSGTAAMCADRIPSLCSELTSDAKCPTQFTLRRRPRSA
jgi:hypothetical protein